MNNLEKFLDLGEVLSREELKMIRGGQEAISCDEHVTMDTGDTFDVDGECGSTNMNTCYSYAQNLCDNYYQMGATACTYSCWYA